MCISEKVLAVFLLFIICLEKPYFRKALRHLCGYVAYCFTSFMNYTPIKYKDDLTMASIRRLTIVKRKTLILDMDETLLSAIIISSSREKDRDKRVPITPCDFTFRLPGSDMNVYVYKRPHVDYFLHHVSRWYDLVVFTAATKRYASIALDYLDGGRNILNRRLYRENCIKLRGTRAKLVGQVDTDLSSIFLLDDSRAVNSFNVGNSIRIKPYHTATLDNQLLCMLPFLDALRFVRDVRSVLQRCTRYDRIFKRVSCKSFQLETLRNIRKFYIKSNEGEQGHEDHDQDGNANENQSKIGKVSKLLKTYFKNRK